MELRVCFSNRCPGGADATRLTPHWMGRQATCPPSSGRIFGIKDKNARTSRENRFAGFRSEKLNAVITAVLRPPWSLRPVTCPS